MALADPDWVIFHTQLLLETRNCATAICPLVVLPGPISALHSPQSREALLRLRLGVGDNLLDVLKHREKATFEMPLFLGKHK